MSEPKLNELDALELLKRCILKASGSVVINNQEAGFCVWGMRDGKECSATAETLELALAKFAKQLFAK